MAHVSSSEICVQWMWKSNMNPWSVTEPEEWRMYCDIEIFIIEESYQNKLPEVLLDDYHIVFKESVQISNTDVRAQRPVKRVLGNEWRQSVSPREQRFLPDPVHPSNAFVILSSPMFNDEVEEYFGIPTDYAKEDYPDIRQIMVRQAARGLIDEGKRVGEQRKAEWMAKELLKVESGTWGEITKCCARLYAMKSFLYKKLNEYMRLRNDDDSGHLWKEKVHTFGPFAWLLDSLANPYTDKKMTVYRSSNLSDDSIEQFCQKADCCTDKAFHFPAFTSTSRNRRKAEFIGGNVLFVIDINEDDGRDLSPHALFDEEETLLLPRCVFAIVSCNIDETTHQWIIHLKSVRY
jgi:hypothetical protein